MLARDFGWSEHHLPALTSHASAAIAHCHSWQATIAHEIGHVLGFHHPDTEWQLNLNANRPMGRDACERALDHVYLNQTQRSSAHDMREAAIARVPA